MSNRCLYVGIDVGKNELWAAVEGRKQRGFENTVAGVRALHKWVTRVDSAASQHFCLEATGVYSRYLAMRLNRIAKAEVSIVNPAQISAYAKAQLRRTKTDRIDAQVILSFAQTQQPPTWSPAESEQEQLNDLLTMADSIRANLQQWANRGHAHGFIPNLPTAVKKCRRAIERTLRRQLDVIEQAIEEHFMKHEQLSDDRDRLCTIPGIAQRSATQIMAYGRNILVDRSPRELVAHAGLAPRDRVSGSSVRGKARLAKQGDGRLRKALFMPTMVGIVHNPVLRKHYRNLCERGKPKMVAIVACMKKLLLIIRSMLINKTAFNPELNTLT